MHQDKETPDVRDLPAQMDYIVELAGVEHVALGPDHCAYHTPVDRNRIRGFGNLGPDFCAFDRRTPLQSEKHPGWNEHGYSSEECEMILGETFLRVYRDVLG